MFHLVLHKFLIHHHTYIIKHSIHNNDSSTKFNKYTINVNNVILLVASHNWNECVIFFLVNYCCWHILASTQSENSSKEIENYHFIKIWKPTKTTEKIVSFFFFCYSAYKVSKQIVKLLFNEPMTFSRVRGTNNYMIGY